MQKLFEHELAVFRVHMSAFWNETDGYKTYGGEAMAEDDDE